MVIPLGLLCHLIAQSSPELLSQSSADSDSHLLRSRLYSHCSYHRVSPAVSSVVSVIVVTVVSHTCGLCQVCDSARHEGRAWQTQRLQIRPKPHRLRGGTTIQYDRTPNFLPFEAGDLS